MKKNIVWRRWFTFLTEKDEGYVISSICYFHKIPWLMNARTLSDEERKEKGYNVENVVMQYKMRFYLDLWLVVLQFQWFTKERTPNN